MKYFQTGVHETRELTKLCNPNNHILCHLAIKLDMNIGLVYTSYQCNECI